MPHVASAHNTPTFIATSLLPRADRDILSRGGLVILETQLIPMHETNISLETSREPRNQED
jgi:hypothetical protein